MTNRDGKVGNDPFRLAYGHADFAEQGWLVMPFRGTSAHYWTLTDTSVMPGEPASIQYRALCGLDAETTARTPALNPGNYPRCQACQRAAQRRLS